MKKVILIVAALVFGVGSLAIACGGYGGYGYYGGGGCAFSGGYGPGSYCSFGYDTPGPNYYRPGRRGFSRDYTNPGAAARTPAPQTK
jgi:hypothetical protein